MLPSWDYHTLLLYLSVFKEGLYILNKNVCANDFIPTEWSFIMPILMESGIEFRMV
jgi:hypothetical protein